MVQFVICPVSGLNCREFAKARRNSLKAMTSIDLYMINHVTGLNLADSS